MVKKKAAPITEAAFYPNTETLRRLFLLTAFYQ
jgi:hypothetical protein